MGPAPPRPAHRSPARNFTPGWARSRLQRARRAVCGFLAAVAAQALSLAAGPAAAEPAAPPPVEAFFGQPVVQQAALSPSGRRLAVTTAVRDRVGLFVIDLQAPGFAATRAALVHDTDVRHFHWVDDDRLVFDLVDLHAGSGEDYRVAPGLFAVRFDGSEFRALVDRHVQPPLGNDERPSTLRWNHELLHVPHAAQAADPARAGHVIVGRLNFAGKDLRSVSPLWLNTRNGRVSEMAVPGAPDNAVHWWFDAAGEARAVLTRSAGREALHWRPLGPAAPAGRWVRLAEAPAGRLPFMPVWVGRGEQLYVSRPEGAAGERVVARFDLEQGRPGKTLVRVPGFDFNGELLSDREGAQLLGLRVLGEAEATVWLQAAGKALQERVDTALPGRVNRLVCHRCDGGDPAVVVRSWSDRHPGQLLLWVPVGDGGAGRWSVVATLRPEIDPARMATVALHRIRARDGRDLPVWVTRPAGVPPGPPRPAVVLVHGGPWVRNGAWEWRAMPQFLASRGYVVIEPEFRGSAGYGSVHLHAGDRQWGQAMQDDVADALRWAQAEKIASDKACIAGGSYGGYSTLMGLIRDPGLYRCGSAWFAVTDLPLLVEGRWYVNDDLSAFGRRVWLPERVGDPQADREMLLANSPVEQAARLQAPLQLVWGEDDLRVPLTHGRRLRDALRAAGLEAEWIVYEGEGHGLRKQENRVDMARRLEAFLARHLQ